MDPVGGKGIPEVRIQRVKGCSQLRETLFPTTNMYRITGEPETRWMSSGWTSSASYVISTKGDQSWFSGASTRLNSDI